MLGVQGNDYLPLQKKKKNLRSRRNLTLNLKLHLLWLQSSFLLSKLTYISLTDNTLVLFLVYLLKNVSMPYFHHFHHLRCRVGRPRNLSFSPIVSRCPTIGKICSRGPSFPTYSDETAKSFCSLPIDICSMYRLSWHTRIDLGNKTWAGMADCQAESTRHPLPMI